MNNVATARKTSTRRSYDNTLRTEHAQQTRQRILDAAVAELGTAPLHGITLAGVARRAGVSEPTLYRHFGSRDRLLGALDQHARDQLGLPPMAASVQDLPRVVTELFQQFEQHGQVLLAATRAGVGLEMRRQGRKRRTEQLRALVVGSAPHLDVAEAEGVAAVMRVLMSWESYRTLTTDLGLDADEAGRAVSSAIEVLGRSLEPAKRPVKPTKKGASR